MRRLLLATSLLTLAAAAPAAAAPDPAPAADTAQVLAAHGATLRFHGTDRDFVFTPDGKFTGMNGLVNGKWRIDGDKICSASGISPTETCVAFPPGKTSGDTFEVTLPSGPATVTIN
jgi:hypothetical protein